MAAGRAAHGSNVIPLSRHGTLPFRFFPFSNLSLYENRARVFGLEATLKSIWSPSFPFAPARFPIFYGWCIALTGTIGAIATIPGQTGGVSVFTDILMEQVGLTRLQVSTAYMIGTALSGFLLPWGGLFFDRYGARQTAVFSAIGLGLAAVFFSQLDRVAVSVRHLTGPYDGSVIGFLVVSCCFFLLRFFGQGMLSLSSRSIIAKWFDRQRAMVLSVSGVVGAVAFAVSPKIQNFGIQSIGWRGTWITIGASLFAFSVLIAWLLFRDNPEECGLVMDGSLDPDADEKPKNPDRILVKELNREEALRTYSFWFFTFTLTWSGLFGTGFVFHIVSVGNEFGLPPGAIFDFLIQSSLFGVVTMLVAGWLSSHTRLKYILAVVGLASTWWAIGMLLMPSLIGQVLIVTGIGVVFGSFGLLSGLVWPRFFGRRHMGAISGVATKWNVIGSALGPLCFAASRSLGGDYRSISSIGIGIGLIWTVGAFFADNPQRKLSESAS